MFDIHTHILPGLDDGARDWNEALDLCEIARADGIKGIVVTPHIREDRYPNSLVDIIEKTGELREKLKGKVDIEIYAGAEVRIATDIVSRVKAGTIPTINDKGYLLLELPEQMLPPRVDDLIFNLKLAGITPIIVHPERYAWIKNETEKIKRFVHMGALIQITAKSVTGGFGKAALSTAKFLLKEGLVSVIASDSHSSGHRPPKLSEALKIAASIIGEETATGLVRENPEKIIKGEPIEVLS